MADTMSRIEVTNNTDIPNVKFRIIGFYPANDFDLTLSPQAAAEFEVLAGWIGVVAFREDDKNTVAATHYLTKTEWQLHIYLIEHEGEHLLVAKPSVIDAS